MSITKMGSQLILDFQNIETINLSDLESIKQIALESLKLSEETISIETVHNTAKGVSLIYQLSTKSHLILHTSSERKTLSVDYLIQNTDNSRKIAEMTEEYFCEKLGWGNSVTNIILDRGEKTQYLQNSYPESSTIFNNFKFIHREKTLYQDLRVYDTDIMGRILNLDGMIQIADALEDNYTVDLPKSVIEKGKSYEHVLIIGAGDMIIPTYLLTNFSEEIKKLTVCEIDGRVIENTKKYFKFAEKMGELVSSGKLEVVIEDGAKYLKDKITEGKHFDGIIVDNSDVFIFEGPAAFLFTAEFYKNIHEVLNTGASFSQQVSTDEVKERWEKMVRSVGFEEISYVYSDTPEYSTALPMGRAKKTSK